MAEDFDADAVARLATATLERALAALPDDARVDEDGEGSSASSPDVAKGDVVQDGARAGGTSMIDDSAIGGDVTIAETTVDEAATTTEEEDANVSYDGSDLVAWINDNGGLVNTNARIGLDPTGRYRGVFVKNDNDEGGTEDGIEEGDIIVRVPW